MWRRRLLVLVCCACALGTAMAGHRTLPDGREFLNETLDNGLELSIVRDDSVELVVTQVWYHVGAADEDDGSRGLAHLFEHLMFGPTDRYEKDEVFQFHTRHGGDTNAFTSWDETVYVSEIAPPHHLEVLALEAARMRGLQLTGDELENEQRIVTEELRLSTENDPFTRVMVTALKNVLGDHPYAVTPVGTKDDIAGATLDACRGFYDRHYQPANAHVVVVGPVDVERTRDRVGELFGGIPPAEVERTAIPALIDLEVPSELTLSEDLPPVEIAFLLYPLPPADHPDADALMMLAAMASRGEANPFREELVRHRGKAVEAGVESLRLKRGGVMAFYAASLPYRRRATAFRWVEHGRDAAREALTEKRLVAARRLIERSDAFGRYSASTTASRIGAARWYEDDVGRAFDHLERVRAVTLDDVHRVWRTWIDDGRAVRLYLKPERVPVLIRMFGWLYPLVS